MYAHLAYVQVEQQRNFAKAQQELQSLTARYRGPLLEAVVDLENRLWHLANATSEWQNSEGKQAWLGNVALARHVLQIQLLLPHVVSKLLV